MVRAFLPVALATGLLLACAKPRGASSDGAASTSTATATSIASEDTCAPAKLGLAGATPGTPWTVPEGCKMTGGNGPASLVKSEAELRALLTCGDAGPKPAIDFAKQSLVLQERTMSPASAGTAVYDDGKTITLVNSFRGSCPGDPLPMPMGFTLAVLVPAGGKRTFREVSCNVETRCK